jgi:uncharacterized protein YktA (UPF0223 family)
MDQEQTPTREEMIIHEVGNIISPIFSALSAEKEGDEGLETGNEVIEAYHRYREALKADQEEERREALEDLRELEYAELPEEASEIVEHSVSLIEAGEAYREVRSGDYSTSEIPTDDIVEMFEFYDGVEVEYPEDVDVEGNEALRLAANTFVKNWQDHGEADEDGNWMRVEYENLDDYIEFQIYDNGPGIDDPEGLFEGNKEEVCTGLPSADFITEEFNGSLDYFEPETGGMGYEWKLSKAQ